MTVDSHADEVPQLNTIVARCLSGIPADIASFPSSSVVIPAQSVDTLERRIWQRSLTIFKAYRAELTEPNVVTALQIINPDSSSPMFRFNQQVKGSVEWHHGSDGMYYHFWRLPPDEGNRLGHFTILAGINGACLVYMNTLPSVAARATVPNRDGSPNPFAVGLRKYVEGPNNLAYDAGRIRLVREQLQPEHNYVRVVAAQAIIANGETDADPRRIPFAAWAGVEQSVDSDQVPIHPRGIHQPMLSPSNLRTTDLEDDWTDDELPDAYLSHRADDPTADAVLDELEYQHAIGLLSPGEFAAVQKFWKADGLGLSLHDYFRANQWSELDYRATNRSFERARSRIRDWQASTLTDV
jgi:hypothetical protein